MVRRSVTMGSRRSSRVASSASRRSAIRTRGAAAELVALLHDAGIDDPNAELKEL